MPFVERLNPSHDRAEFDCGNVPLNIFLQRQARQNADRNLGVTHVVVEQAGDSRILGYYTLLTHTVDAVITQDRKLPSGNIGIVLLGRLAVDKTAQGRGLGQQMLLRAMNQTAQAAKTIGIYAFVLDAIDERARDWYLSLNFGFRAFTDDSRHLFVPLSYIAQIEFAPLTGEL